MAELGAIRPVFIRRRISPAAQFTPAAHHLPPSSPESSEQPEPSPATPAARRSDSPAFIEQALAMMERYVRTLARNFSRGRDLAEDLYSEGMFAVARAFETFRGDEGISFAGYAWRNARWQMVRTLREEIRATRYVASFDEPLSEEGDFTLLDTIPAAAADPAGSIERRLRVAQVRQAVARLHGRKRLCVELLMEGLTQFEVAARLGISHQRVQQLLPPALEHLRRRLTPGMLLERETRAGRVGLAALRGETYRTEESSGALASSWPGRAGGRPGLRRDGTPFATAEYESGE